MSIIKKNWKYLLIVGLSFRLILFLLIRPWNAEVEDKKILISDPSGYHSLALSIKKSGFTDRPFAFRTPGYPLFIYAIYFFTGAKPWIIILVNFLIALVSGWLLYKIALLFFSANVSFLTATLFLMDPHINLFNQTLFSETLFISLFLLSIYLFLKWVKNYKTTHLIMCAVMMGIATLVRPVSIYFPIVLVLGYLFFFFKRQKQINWKSIVLYLSLFYLTLSPWMLRNYFRYGNYSISTIQGYNLLFCNSTFSEAVRTGKEPEEIEKEFKREAIKNGIDDKYGNPFVNAEYYQKVALSCMYEQPAFYAKRFFNGFLFSYLNLNVFEFCNYLNLSYTPHSWGLYQNPSFYQILKNYFKGKTRNEIFISVILILWLVFSYLMAFAGIFFLIKKKHFWLLTFIMITIFYFAFLAGDVGEVRYKLPAIPFYLLLSGVGFYGLIRTNFLQSPPTLLPKPDANSNKALIENQLLPS